MNEVMVNVSGNVFSDPIVRRTSTGDAFLTFRLAVNEKKRSSDGAWVDGDTQFFSVTSFRTLASNGYHSLSKGQHILVSGRLRISKYTTNDGEQRTSVQIDAHDIGPSLKFGRTTFTRCLEQSVPSPDRLADREVEEATRAMEAKHAAGGSDSFSASQTGQKDAGQSEVDGSAVTVAELVEQRELAVAS